MGWFCPTFQRPERLAELALSWERCQPETPLQVRVWEKDPRREDYFKYDWPETWHFTVTGAEWAGDALNQYYDWKSNEPFYGFIGDDIVLRTVHGLDALEQAAGKMFMAFPNDTVWRHQLATHFCLGGDTVRAMGFIIPRNFYHFHMDMALQHIMMNCGLMRYCPQVIFQHKHFLFGTAYRDDTYRKVYGDIPVEETVNMPVPGQKEWDKWMASDAPQKIVMSLRQKLVQQYERPQEWADQDYKEMQEAYEDEPILCDKAE